MLNRFSTPIAILAALLILGGKTLAGPKKAPKELTDLYNDLNNHLTKTATVTSTMRTDIKKVADFVNDERNKKKAAKDPDSHPMRAYEVFLSMANLEDKAMCNDQALAIFQENERALDDEIRKQGGNYRLRMVDKHGHRFLAHYAIKCMNYLDTMKPDLPLLLWQRAYDEVEVELAEIFDCPLSEVTIDEIYTVLGELRAKWHEKMGSGALSWAMDQLQILSRVTKEKYCDYDGFEQVIVNYMATKYRSKKPEQEQERLIDKFVSHFAYEFAGNCLISYRRQFPKWIRRLPAGDRRTLLEMVQELSFDQLEEDGLAAPNKDNSVPDTGFRTPSLERIWMEWLDKQPSDLVDVTPRTERSHVSVQFLHKWLKSAGKDDPDVMWLDSATKDQNPSGGDDRPQAIHRLIQRIILTPCNNYLIKLGSNVFEPHEFASGLNPEPKFPVMSKEEFARDLDFLIGRQVHVICRQMIRDESSLVPSLEKFIMSPDGR